MFRTSWAVAAVIIGFVVPAFGEGQSQTSSWTRPKTWRGDRLIVVDTPVDKFVPHDSLISPWIYLNRCSGGCQIQAGAVNDARTNTSTIPGGSGPFTVAEFKDTAGNTGALADAEWNQVVQCLKEVYSPFAVTIVDQRPTTGVSYTMAVIAGMPQDIGLGAGILGIAPIAGDCSPQDNVISFSFANYHAPNNRVLNICWTAAQETAHALGLDHSYEFSDGTSACNDPMTYRTDCGGQKFFRNKPARCGENALRDCSCGGSQNSHLRIRNVYGPGNSLIPPPTSQIVMPLSGTITNNSAIAVSAGSQRGVEKVELWLNGFKWSQVPGASFGAEGQLNPSGYSLLMPAGVPDGNIDIVAKAYDDLLIETDSQTVTVVKGAPCASAMTCAKGQKCEAGYCRWDAAAGEIGDSCDYPQYCISGICADAVDGHDFCSQECYIAASDACPMGYTCEVGGGLTGLCAPESSGGCCGAARTSNSLWIQIGISGLVLGFVVRRRRRR